MHDGIERKTKTGGKTKMTQQEFYKKIEEVKKEFNEKLQELYNINNPVAEQPKRWKPQDEENYWSVECARNIYSTHWNDDSVDNWIYLTGNCFKTKKEAEEYKKQIEYTARYKNYIEEHSEPLDWENDKQCKYLVEFSYNGHRITINNFYALKKQGAIYASSPEIIRDAIKEIGEDNFKKYVLGVK